ncbi:MAG: hypothetical protein ACJAW1_000252 [Glaciecola sp.]|jgi:uncharacterized protein (TIGR02099 family)
MTTQANSGSKVGAATTFVVKKLWTLFAITLVVIALFMSLLRYSLPFLNDHKEYFESYIANEYSIDLEIGELSASWLNDGPAIVLRNVNIKDGTRSPLTLKIGEVFLEVDFWPSIASRKLQSNDVVLNKLELALDLTRIENANSDFPIIDALENIFLEQLSNFVVSNSRVTLITQANKQAIDITKLSWLNKENRHQGVGEFALEGVSDNNASFILDLYGNVDSYSGTLFAQAQDVNLSAWINEFIGLESQLVSSKGNVEAWIKIENGQLKRIDGQILPTTFEWTTDQSTISNSIKGRFAAIKGEQQWDFSIDDLYLETQGNVLVSGLNGYFSSQNGVVFQLPDPLSLKPLFSLSSLYSLVLADTLAMIDADAQLVELIASIDQNGLTLQADIQDIGWQEHNEVAGLTNLQASILWQDKRGKVVLNASDTAISSQYYFSRSLPVRTISIPVLFDISELESREAGYSAANIIIKDAFVEIDGLQLEIDSEYAAVNNFLSLAVNVLPFGLEKVPELLPKHFIGEGTNGFLKNAFMGTGKVTAADVMWHGALDGFPFDDNTGVFQSNVSVEQADFSFSNGWPALTKLDIDLFFENNGLAMQGPSSLLDKVALTNLEADIPNLSANAMLTITADGAATSEDITSLMLQSSLADSLGELLYKDVLVDGDLTTQLALYIPLNDGSKTRAKGEVYLRNNTVSIPAINLAFNDTQGMVSFDNETISINAMRASLLEQPVTIDVSGKQSPDQYSLTANMVGNWQMSVLAQNVSKELATLFEGTTPWNLDLALNLMAKDFTYVAELTSDLDGVNADLPYPLAKTAVQNLPLTLIAKGDRIASSVDLTLGNVAHFDGALAHKEKQFNRAHLALGPTELESRGLGFSISANFDNLLVDSWYPFIKALTSEIDASKTNLIGVPKRIFIDTEKLSIAGQSFNDVDVTIKRLDDQWAFDVDSNELRGNITLFDEWFSKGIVVDAEYIRIAKVETNDTLTEPTDEIGEIDPKGSALSQFEMDPKSFPSINFTCKSCDIRGINLGRVELEAQPNSDGLKITQLMINNEFGNVNTSGQWYKRNQDHYTFIAGDLNSSDFGEFVNQLGFDSGIEDSSANLSFALTWKDSPMDLKFENLDGQIDWRLSDGSLSEVSDQGSRLFTLLSLNSLVRKLSLDFRDVFAKGFFYDNMKGSVQIAQGIADTRDTLIDGAAGEIEIYGNTDLASQALNYNVNFTPNVTGNLPILVYFFTVSPPTALAALAIDQVLTSAKVISNINYSVTGTIAEPILIETGRQSTEVDLPARTEYTPTDDLPPFVPPTKDDLVEIELQGGQSD